jgi:NADH-quinone oxidoreductase subunit L
MFVLLAGVSVLAGVIGAGIGFLTYRRPQERWESFERSFEPLWGTWEAAYRVDDLYGAVLVAPGKRIAEATAFGFDLPVVDGAVNGIAAAVRRVGLMARPLQNGLVRSYGVAFMVGVTALVIWLIFG